MFAHEERARAVEWSFTTAMTTAQVVEYPGYPTGRCPGRRLAADSRYAGRMAEPIIALETRRKAIELVPGGMRRKQAAGKLGVSVGAVHNRVRAYRKGGMASLQPKNGNAARKPTPVSSADVGDDTGALRRRVAELESGKRVDAGGGGGRRKRPRRRLGAPDEPGEDRAGRLAAPDVFAELFGHAGRRFP